MSKLEGVSAGWKPALLHAAPISLSILGLFYYWFAVADRYAIFLYGHRARGIPEATPFDEMTSSRYWMAGLVACGAVMVVYAVVNWLLGRFVGGYRPPVWRRVWALCAPPLAVGILGITTTLNRPTLPLPNGAACAAATLIGLAFALAPGAWAALRPCDLAWLALDGAGLMPTLLLLRAVELPGRGLSVSVSVVYLMVLGGAFAGVVWLGIMTGLRVWRRKSPPGAGALFVAGLCLSYLLMPLVHHLLATPPQYRYISAASNFFAFNLWVQLVVFFVAAILALGVARLRRRLP